jgi:serine/threonine protein phosphatase PrpC
MSIWQRIQRLFQAKDVLEIPRSDEIQTAPLIQSDTLTGLRPVQATNLIAGSAISPGLSRDNNEDSLLVFLETANGDHPPPNFGIFCLADGAGGHKLGEIASALAIKAATRSLLENSFIGYLHWEATNDGDGLVDKVKTAVGMADQIVKAQASGGVTTLTVAMVVGNEIVIGHAGDSRAYLFNGDHSEIITRDHSYPARLVEIGQLPPDEAHDHPKRNQLWNAVGQASNLVIETYHRPVPDGGHLLLCSDGLWSEVDEELITQIVEESTDPNQACTSLVDAAMSSGGQDNISAILVSFPRD